jgi:hypothetical protein
VAQEDSRNHKVLDGDGVGVRCLQTTKILQDSEHQLMKSGVGVEKLCDCGDVLDLVKVGGVILFLSKQ